MKKEVAVDIYIRIDGEYHRWDSLTEEKQKEISIELNDRAMKAIGYTHSKKFT